MWKIMLDNILNFQSIKPKAKQKQNANMPVVKVKVVTGIELIVWLDSSWQEFSPGPSCGPVLKSMPAARDQPRLIQGIRRRDGVGEDQETIA